MAETIYSIPLNETFDEAHDCPLCRLRAKLERDSLEYILGPAMMEPDIRIETNRLGFCRSHYDKMIGMKNRLGLALTLQSRMAEVKNILSTPPDGGRSFLGKKNQEPQAVFTAADNCYVCRRVKGFEEKLVANTVYLWKTDDKFREKLKKQQYFCLSHASALLRDGSAILNKNQYSELHADVTGVCVSHLDKLYESLSGFIESFDHRKAGVPLTDEQRKSVESCAEFLSGLSEIEN